MKKELDEYKTNAIKMEQKLQKYKATSVDKIEQENVAQSPEQIAGQIEKIKQQIQRLEILKGKLLNNLNRQFSNSLSQSTIVSQFQDKKLQEQEKLQQIDDRFTKSAYVGAQKQKSILK